MIEDRLTKVFRDVFDDDQITLRRDMTAADIDDWDSISHVNLLVAIESEFAVHFEIGEFKQLKNVGGMMDLIEAKLK
jgi:acyl carrier protein